MGKSDTATVSREAGESIADRLSLIDDLYYPRKVQSSAAANPSYRKSLLLDLLSRDAAVFLERYGSNLSLTELDEFDVLKEDYEINWHLNRLRSVMSPTEEEKKSKSVKVKNRRLAYMDRLILDGHYFSEDAMREREPYLHHEYVGKFQDPSGRSMARPGERWSETLMRRSEEAILVEKIRGEQQRAGVAQSDWIGNEPEMQEEVEEEEEEEEEEEDEEENENKKVVEETTQKGGEDMEVGPSSRSQQKIENKETNLELSDRMEQFTYIMQQKFLSGADHGHMDYLKIDEDETLDDHWMKVASQDAEDKYFDDV
ncbi:uncharacterized protein [Henckelia pumila]|uniref:uncharacterized protein n=1 Tax=Henckelia pumila TaxID=405737 RepID=UPI003C6E5129